MQKNNNEQSEETLLIARSILEYLENRKDAADTLKGMLQWWIARQRILEHEQKVHDAVSYLCEEGKLIKHNLPGGSIIYALKDSDKSSDF